MKQHKEKTWHKKMFLYGATKNSAAKGTARLVETSKFMILSW